MGLGKFPRQYDKHEIRCESPAWSRVTSTSSASRDERRPRPQRRQAGVEPRSPRSLTTSRLASPPAPAPPRLPPRGAGGSGSEPGSERLSHRARGIAELRRRRRRNLCPERHPRSCRRGHRAGLREGSGGDGRCRRRERARASTAAPLGQVRGGAGTAGGGAGMEGAGPERLRTKLYQLPRRGDRREPGHCPIEELSARAGGRSDAVLDQ